MHSRCRVLGTLRVYTNCRSSLTHGKDVSYRELVDTPSAVENNQKNTPTSVWEHGFSAQKFLLINRHKMKLIREIGNNVILLN